MNIRKKASGIAFTVTLIAALIAVIAAPVAYANSPGPLLFMSAGFPILDAFTVSLLIASAVALAVYFTFPIAFATFRATRRTPGRLLAIFVNNNSSSTTNPARLPGRRLFDQLVAFVASLSTRIVRQVASLCTTLNATIVAFVPNSAPSRANNRSVLGTLLVPFAGLLTRVVQFLSSFSMRSPSPAGIRSLVANACAYYYALLYRPRGQLVLAYATHTWTSGPSTQITDVDDFSPIGEPSTLSSSSIDKIATRRTSSATSLSELRE